MAYEEKTTYEDDTSLYSFLRLINILVKKWWVILIFMIIFGLTGFIFSRVTYTEQYSSQVIFNVSNKDKDIAGSASLYVTQSDAQASGMIANNFKNLIENGNDFVSIIQKEVKEKTGDYVWLSADQISGQTALPTAFRQFWEEVDHV